MPLALPGTEALVSAQALAAYGIVINLAYLNLPNLRFPQRIKKKILQVIGGYEDVYSDINANSAQYKGLYDLADFDEIRDLPSPTAFAGQIGGGFFVGLFMFIWCTPVQLTYTFNTSTIEKRQIQISLATQPIDKLISAVLLCVCNMYLFYLMGNQVNSNSTSALTYLFYAFEYSIGAIAIFSLVRRDIVTAIIAGLALWVTHLSIYNPDAYSFIPNASDPVQMLTLFMISVLVTALLVAFSHMLYPMVERHFAQQATNILEQATEKNKTRNSDNKERNR